MCANSKKHSEFCPSHILVTGGAGFIGSNFVHYIAKYHPDVAVSVLDSLTYAGNINNLRGLPGDFKNKRYAFIHGDVRDSNLVDQLLNPSSLHKTDSGNALPAIDAIVHFAAESHNDNAIEYFDPFMSTNIYGTYVLLNSARKYDIRFHHVSTDEVYGDFLLNSRERFNENSPYRPSSPYSASKAASDHLVRAWCRTYGLRATISNSGNNYGPRQHIEKFIPRQITNIICNMPVKLYGKGDSVRDWIYVEDNCDAIWQVLVRGTICETYIIGAQCEMNNISLLKMLLTIMGKTESCIMNVNERPGEDKRYALDASKIRTQLGWSAKHLDMRQNLQETIDWYAANVDLWEPIKNQVEQHYAASGH
ncbi:dTDP-glucose 4,6-dehydratase [Bifidobacterium sp. UMB6791A]|nr:dTDP-glucose 4,6-dehydratase [Bifidobacterium sp. UMB6791B]MDK8248859.1 dTDP-glucose 4,6-dehydratase [Bifidobacterium sp. UMB6794B]MDK8635361.1 dTDP-glucose 4,6-dehydratase [Bifidobacterium sp. UMB6791A]